MKKEKLKLSGLHVKSFTTSENRKVKGGATQFCTYPTLFCEISERITACADGNTNCIVP
jgi:hypothetical protein